jgi:DNA-binding response OmpR family regulator
VPPPRKILIADPDPATARELAPALRRNGWQVHAARDGSRALQLAILRFPDVVLFDEHCPLLEPRTFARILRTNPRTERTPVVVMGERGDPDRARLGGYLEKPLREEVVLARVEQVYRRVEAGRAVASENRELEGNLAQIALADLLQVMGQNRKSGRLALLLDGERAEVLLREGAVVDATAGAASGEKALFRLLGIREGKFSFTPGEPEGQGRIDRRTEELVLEGLRQVDEAAVVRPSLPGPGDRIELAVAAAEVPPGLHPVTEEVVRLLDRPLPLSEILDRTQATDLEALRAVAALLEGGWARRREAPPAAPAAEPLLDAADVHQLRARIARGRASGAQAAGKVLVAGGGPLSRRAALARFAAVPGFAAEPEPPAGLGSLGRIDLGDGVRVDLFQLPLERDLLPAWRAFAPGALGALVLLPSEGLCEEHAVLLRDLRLPAAVCGPSPESVPRLLVEGPQPASFEGADVALALRALLAGAGRRLDGTRIAPP